MLPANSNASPTAGRPTYAGVPVVYSLQGPGTAASLPNAYNYRPAAVVLPQQISLPAYVHPYAQPPPNPHHPYLYAAAPIADQRHASSQRPTPGTESPQDARSEADASSVADDQEPQRAKRPHRKPEMPQLREVLMDGTFSVKCYEKSGGCLKANEDLTARPAFQCQGGCETWFHQACITTLRTWSRPPLAGDDHYYFVCRECSPKSTEQIFRLSMNWGDVLHIALYNLSLTAPGRPAKSPPVLYGQPSQREPLEPCDGPFYGAKLDVVPFVQAHWTQFWLRAQVDDENLLKIVSRILSVHPRFAKGGYGLWGLKENMPLSCYVTTRKVEYAIDETGSLLELSDQQKALFRPVKGSRDSKKLSQKEEKDLKATSVPSSPKRQQKRRASPVPNVSAKPAKRRNLKKARAPRAPDVEIDPATAIEMYYDIANPVDPPRLSIDNTHRAPQMIISDACTTVTTEKGYRMAKATHGVWEGAYYYEARINEPSLASGNVRIGWSQISGDLQAPCGYDRFSYGYRARPGTLFHMSQAIQPTDKAFAEGYGPGDVIGMAIYLPRREAGNGDLVAREWDGLSLYVPFRAPPMEVMSGSYIVYYKNGKSLGVAFRNLNRGKYHPAISCYNGGSATVNFGPDFKYPIPDGFKGFHEVVTLPPLDESDNIDWIPGTPAELVDGGDAVIPEVEAAKARDVQQILKVEEPEDSGTFGHAPRNDVNMDGHSYPSVYEQVAAAVSKEERTPGIHADTMGDVMAVEALLTLAGPRD
ncbi:hypothetical protein BC832DRAFT_590094 [Gaertneriomyces semiglobifer]|nr:hypothetical protein BC832DRAFT_590094 [Gaertneriomyces semiglobifer]